MRELRIQADTGETIIATVYLSTDGTTHGAITLTESPTMYYTGNFPSIAAGTYDVVYKIGSSIISGETIQWSGTAVVTGGTVSLDPSVANEIDAIKQKTDLISSGGISVVSPIDAGGKVTITRGQDYLNSKGNALSFSSLGTLPDLSGATATISIQHGGVWYGLLTPWHTQRVSVTGTIASPSSNPTITFELPNAVTSTLYHQYNRYQVIVTFANGSTLTIASGQFIVNE